MITVFYDAKCGLCSREIKYYKSIAPLNTFTWLDVATSYNDLSQFDIEISEALKVLHVVDNNNKIYRGVDAFILVWQELKYWRVIARLVSLPFVKITANYIYTLFAHWRFNKLKHCQLLDKT